MPIPAEKADSRLMRQMFGVIAPRYDFITRVFSYGMDRRWKRQGVEKALMPDKPVVLDLACGTGDFSKLVAERFPEALTIAAMALPFADQAFDCVFIGYGLRNFPRLDNAVAEIERVTRPGGLLVSLDFFLPRNPLLRQIYLGYLFMNGVFWGTILHGRPRIYTYIPDSLRSFVSIDDFSSLLRRNGYGRVDARGFLFGGIALHWAAKE